jgi:hypothetical protein
VRSRACIRVATALFLASAVAAGPQANDPPAPAPVRVLDRATERTLHQLQTRAIEAGRRGDAAEHRTILDMLRGLTMERGDYVQAASYAEEQVSISRRLYGATHHVTAQRCEVWEC